MKGRSLYFAILWLLSVTGLFAQTGIVGTWQEVAELADYPGSHAGIVFGQDGSFIYNGPGAYQCRYSVNGKMITLTACDFDPAATQQMRIVSVNATTLIVQELGGQKRELRTYHRVADATAETPTGNSYSVNDHVQVQWQGSWYPAVILKVEGNKYLIHYDGYESSWDEWVTEDRMKR